MAFVWHVTDRDHGTVAAIFTGPGFLTFAGVACLYSDYHRCAAKYIQTINGTEVLCLAVSGEISWDDCLW